MHWNEFLPHIRHLSARNQKRVKEAFMLGEIMHRKQKRKSGEPYFLHPISVALRLIEIDADSDTIIAALLHDTVEDTPLTLEEIHLLFDGAVAALIDGLTKLSDESLAEKPNLDAQVETLRKMFTLMQQDVRIMVIKLYDRLHNMQTIEHLSPDRQISFAKETMEVYVKIADRLSMYDLRYELSELCLRVLEPVDLQRMIQMRLSNRKKADAVLQTIERNIREAFPAEKQKFRLHYEKRQWEKMQRRLQIEDTPVTGFPSLTMVFVCDAVQDCYETLGMLHQLWHRETLSFQDYINAPALNGYRGLHTTIILDDGTRVRCKIRTATMQEYAHRGVTVFCFDEKSLGLEEYLPWASRISPVAADTKDRSTEFWDSLQNDILGESIVIHGPGDETVSLPKGSTVLDGVFYLLGREALRTREIRLNGIAVPFNEPLQFASTLTATLADDVAMELSWLQHVHTGIASALIRQELAQRKREEKIASGRWLLQEHFNRRGRGFLSEFNHAQLANVLRAQGYGSLEDVFVQLAEGRTSPEEVEEALFVRKKENAQPARHSYRILLHVPDVKQASVLELVQRFDVTNVHVQRESGMILFLLFVRLTDDERRMMEELLTSTLGRTGWRVARAYSRLLTSLGIALLFLVWGLDPVFARILLTAHHVPPLDLTVVRFWSLTAMSGLLLVLARLRNPLGESRIPLRNRSLWLSVILLVMVAITTYFSLTETLPAHYSIPMTAAGLLLTSLVNRRRWPVFVITWLLLIGSAVALVVAETAWQWSGILFTLAAVIAFSAYSVVSERYKQQEEVDVRAAQYFFWLSLFCALLTLPLLSVTHIGTIPYSILARAILFSIFVSGLPYYMYYYILSHKQLDFVLRYSFLIIIVTTVGQMIFLQTIDTVTVVTGFLVAVGAMLPLVTLRRKT